MRKSWKIEKKEINKKVEEIEERMKKMEIQERSIEKLEKKIDRIGKDENVKKRGNGEGRKIES